MVPEQTEVLVVGAGPTGLALAVALRQAGVAPVVVDRLAQGLNTSRAAVLHAHTLETLAGLGVSAALVERGLRLASFSVRDRDRVLVRLRFDGLPSDYPFLLMVPQDVTERVLEDRLAALGGTVHRGVTATAVSQDAASARVTLDDGGATRTIAARYVVGADGMHSVVRPAAGIDFAGGAYAESFVLADVRMDWPPGRDEGMLFFSPAGLVVVAPLPGGAFRVVATCDDAPEHPGVGDVQALIDARGPQARPGAVTDVIWSSRFRIHHRLAETYRDRRLLVMGDAAHVHSPAGGQGMNAGLVDACVLGRLLAGVIRDGRPDTTLDAYEALRRPAAAEVLVLAGRLTALATMRGRSRRVLRNALLSAAGRVPAVRRRLQRDLSGLSRRHLAVVPE